MTDIRQHGPDRRRTEKGRGGDPDRRRQDLGRGARTGRVDEVDEVDVAFSRAVLGPPPYTPPTPATSRIENLERRVKELEVDALDTASETTSLSIHLEVSTAWGSRLNAMGVIQVARRLELWLEDTGQATLDEELGGAGAVVSARVLREVVP